MYGLVLARYNKFPEVKVKGVASLGNLVAFTSQEVFFNFQIILLLMLTNLNYKTVNLRVIIP